ncbi:MAG: ATP-dependent 6-phosphofructokinase [Planctomycetaceae bacterium]|nr:ATP-dependent 6-phosphofructokinase [Planctomycetaceae bacterium]
MLKPEDVVITSLGPCRFDSPLRPAREGGFVSDSARILQQAEVSDEEPLDPSVAFEKAGPRKRIFFQPSRTTAAIVTCGGLCPGLNNVIRSATLELIFNYGVKRVLGIRYGFRGLNPQVGDPPIELTPEYVERIHYLGGTVLGSSRGPQSPELMVDFLEREQIDMLFCVGGDGTQRGAQAIFREVRRRGLTKAVVGIPKTIDNDIAHVTTTFGYATALSKAEEVLRGAHTEARQAVNGIGLVRLMGRDAGFIAAGAALVSQEANFVLIPEVPFPLDGEDGLLAALERRILRRAHALIVVAEGAGQHLFAGVTPRTDASGNAIHEDIGLFLRERIQDHFARRNIPISLKYLDPSYLIRSIPATAWDMVLSDQMARHAVHAAMCGKSDVLIASWYSHFVHIPIRTIIGQRKSVDLDDMLWTGVLATTGQPRW